MSCTALLRGAIGLGAAAALLGCGATPRAGTAVAPAGVVAPEPVPTRRVAAPATTAGGIGPEILLPTGGADPVVATVGEVEIRASQVFARQAESDRQRAAMWVDALVLDVVVAGMAREYGISLDAAAVDAAVAEEEALFAERVARDYGGRLDVAAVLARQFGLTVDEYRQTLRRDLARVRLRGLVIRYVATLEDRAEVRFMVHDDREILSDARRRVAEGADFARLAKDLSQDETRRSGGRLGPFPRSFRHPIAAASFELEPGEQSPILPIDDGERFALVYCLERLAADPRPFSARAAELARDLDERPVTPFEQNAFMMRYCRSTEGASPGPVDR